MALQGDTAVLFSLLHVDDVREALRAGAHKERVSQQRRVLSWLIEKRREYSLPCPPTSPPCPPSHSFPFPCSLPSTSIVCGAEGLGLIWSYDVRTATLT